MSRSQRGQEVSTVTVLKKELNNAGVSIQALKTRIESIEQALVDSRQATDQEEALKQTIHNLETSVRDLQAELKTKHDAFAESVLSIDITFGTRLREYKEKWEQSLTGLDTGH